MYGRSMFRSKEPGIPLFLSRELDLREFEKKLGAQAELGVSFELLDINGLKVAEAGYHAETTLPMASTNKIAIALVVLQSCYDQKSQLRLNQKVSIKAQDLSPGITKNPLDQYYYKTNIKDPVAELTIAELLNHMMIHSDNTSADKLLELIGGIEAVNSCMQSYECYSFKLTRNLRGLLASAFGLNETRSKETIDAWLALLENKAFELHYDTEVETYLNSSDACSPGDMTALLHKITRAFSAGHHSPLNKPAIYLMGLMRNCKTGEQRIKKILETRSDIEFVAHKTGSLGGVTNDAAMIKFSDGQFANITIYTAYAEVDIKTRESIIADIAVKLVKDYKPIARPDKQYSVSY